MNIWDTDKFEQLRKFVINFYSDLIDFTSQLVYTFEVNEEELDNYIIKDELNNYLNEHLN